MMDARLALEAVIFPAFILGSALPLSYMAIRALRIRKGY